MLECPECQRRLHDLRGYANMYDTERRRREKLEEQFTRLKREAAGCQCLKRLLEENL